MGWCRMAWVVVVERAGARRLGGRFGRGRKNAPGAQTPGGGVCCVQARVCWPVRWWAFVLVEVRFRLFFVRSARADCELIFEDWRRPPHPVATPEYAAYVQILTWFIDTPAPHAPFSVHRMALAGKELGTDVGQWFGPSVAAGAIKYVFPPYISPFSTNIFSLFCVV